MAGEPCQSPQCHPGEAGQMRSQMAGSLGHHMPEPLQPSSAGSAARSPARERTRAGTRPGSARRSGRGARGRCRWPRPGWVGRPRSQVLGDTQLLAQSPLPGHLLLAGAADPHRPVIDVAADHRTAHVQPQHESLRALLLQATGQPRHPGTTRRSAAATARAGAL
jgi:hypothetical protein